MEYELVIFDCDGTLVDSERLYNEIASELLMEVGLPQYTPEVCFRLFSGKSWSTMLRALEKKHDVNITKDIITRYVQMAKDRMETELKMVDGIYDVVKTFYKTIPICVGSNGDYETVLKSLNITGLDAFFSKERVFTKIMVPNPKPAPDLFLYIADHYNVAPEKILIFEDSVAGVQAGVAAGMQTIGFCGTALDKEHHTYLLKSAGAHAVIDDVIHMQAQLKH